MGDTYLLSLGIARFLANSREQGIGFHRELIDGYNSFFSMLETELLGKMEEGLKT